MTTDKSFMESIKSGIQKIAYRMFTESTGHTVDPNYKIKYDNSVEELLILGFVDEMGVVCNRDGYSLYRQVVSDMEEIRKLPDFEWLKAQGIASAEGKILDEHRYSRYKQTLLNKRVAEKTL